jgi:beta-N-acetylhexosaminidase
MTGRTANLSVLTTLLPGFAGTSPPDWLRARLRDGLGGVCLFGPNIESLPQLQALTEALSADNPHALIAVDEEGGDVTRLFADVGSPSPGNAVLGRIDDPDTTRTAAAEIGWQLRRAGCHVNFAPTVDINSNANNPVIGVRSFGATPKRVARHGAAWVMGLQSAGIAATVKHFPGHGDTAQDSHVALPVVDRSLEDLRRGELVPFVATIKAGARLVMTSHILLPQVDAENPATMSRAILVDLLRGQLGFTGVIVSDALDMAGAQSEGGMGEAAVRALRAGCDLLCLGTETADAQLVQIEQAVEKAVATGQLEAERLADAVSRVRTLADDLARLRTRTAGATEPALDLDDLELIDSFDLAPDAANWATRTAGAYSVVRLEAQPNIATGPTPWGPFAAAAAEPRSPASIAFAAHPLFEVTERQSVLPPAVAAEPVLVVGRDIHRHEFARAAVDRLRGEHTEVLVVDLGWPSEDRAYADVATFGSSRLVGRALLAFLDGAAGEAAPAP